jgi:hypothetical protein
MQRHDLLNLVNSSLVGRYQFLHLNWASLTFTPLHYFPASAFVKAKE